MRKVQQGFTLIELMIVVAIIGILAAIAIPQYTDYIQRSKVSGAVGAMSSVKQGVAECIQFTSSTATCDEGNDTYSLPATFSGDTTASRINYVQGLNVANGVITVTTTGVDESGSNMVVTLTPNTANPAAIRWNLTGSGCASNTPGRGIPCAGN